MVSSLNIGKSTYRNMESYGSMQALRNLMDEGEVLGLDFSVVRQKVDSYESSKATGKIKIVLLGSFSDGKTTAIAGLLGRLETNMKIDEDESSDQLSVYRVESLGSEYEIVDTPGLFGTKEREQDGENVRFSEITERYISEAHIVVYVCNSVNTLKDSHKTIIKRVLRDYNKLSSAIFVINKMDEVADVEDDAEFAEVSLIKRNTFVNRLKQVLLLTPDEEKELRIACIAANPYGDGLAKWFQNKSEYNKLSHIGELKRCVESVIEKSDIAQLKLDASKAVSKDLAHSIAFMVASRTAELKKALSTIRVSLEDLDAELSALRLALSQSRGVMTDRLKALQDGLNSLINGISEVADLQAFLQSKIGITGKNVDFYIIRRDLNQILSECVERNNAQLDSKVVMFEQKLSAQSDLLDNVMKGGLSWMKKVNNTTVLKARDMFFKSHKFKPWGAVKLASKIGAAAAVVGMLWEAWTWWQKEKERRKLEEMKSSLQEVLSGMFKSVFERFDDDEKYYKEFAPSFIELRGAVGVRKSELADMQKGAEDLGRFKSRVITWYGADIEDVDFEDIKI